MDDWRPQKAYGTSCEQWYFKLEHLEFPVRNSVSRIWLELEEDARECNMCGETWDLQDFVLYCFCGAVQPMEYTYGELVIEKEGLVLTVEGDVVYVQRKSGALVVGYRTYLNCGYD